MISVDLLITGLNVVGGAEVFTSQLAMQLTNHNIQPRVICLRSGGSLVSELKNQGIQVVEIDINNKFNPFPIFNLYKLWHTSPPTILHTHLYHAGVIGRLIARCTGIPHVIIHQHGTENSRSTLRTILDRISSFMVDQYIVPSNAVLEILMKREHISPAKIKVIHYGINTEQYTSAKPISSLSIPPGIPIIGCVSRLVREKSHPDLLKALFFLRQHDVKFHAIIVGDGPERNDLEKLSRALGISEFVTWVGLRRDIPAWLSTFDLFVLPSAWEGLPISILEAMAARLPVVATAVGGTPEIVLADETGLLVPPSNPEQLFFALQQLLLDSSLRIKMGTAGFIRVLKHFSMNSATELIINLYNELIR